MLEFLLGPVRSVLGAAEHEIVAPEREVLDAVDAIHAATESIERHVATIEGLATAVGPLADSVDRLTATMNELVTMLAPLAGAERSVERVERRFAFRRHHEPDGPLPRG
ncbi:MAG TPA: hypothetical protein VLP43_02310 [Solirubrobacteraceae bacterium]|nr:hypothetical protein [Solirubrobacteraceae bacterium]